MDISKRKKPKYFIARRKKNEKKENFRLICHVPTTFISLVTK
jgi:hypothetical protein